MNSTGSGDSADRTATSGSVLPSHQERKKTSRGRKAAAQARAAENMRMVAAAQAAGVVPQKVTRAYLGGSFPERAAARARAVKAAAAKSQKVPAKRAASRTQAPPPSMGIGTAMESTSQQKTGGPSTLFDLIAQRGLHISGRTNESAAAPSNLVKAITGCPVRFVIETQADPSIDWKAKCLRLPFDAVWLEYPHHDRLCGALIKTTNTDGRRLSIQYVTSSRGGSDIPLSWPGPETVKLAADGLLAYRQPAHSERNKAAQIRTHTIADIFDDLYIHLAVINEVHTGNLWPSRSDTNSQALPATIHKSNGPVILMWGDPPVSASRGPLDGPRHAPNGHQVRGHQRRLHDGTTTWVRSHRRGDGEPERKRTYQVKTRDNGRQS